jgi:hypothetical protein
MIVERKQDQAGQSAESALKDTTGRALQYAALQLGLLQANCEPFGFTRRLSS